MSLYRKTFLDSTQITGSLVSNDGVALDKNSAVSGTLEDNLNAIRSAIKLVLGSTTSDTWWDVVSRANGLNLVQLNKSISGTLYINALEVTGANGITSNSGVTGSFKINSFSNTGGLVYGDSAGNLVTSGNLVWVEDYQALVLGNDAVPGAIAINISKGDLAADSAALDVTGISSFSGSTTTVASTLKNMMLDGTKYFEVRDTGSEVYIHAGGGIDFLVSGSALAAPTGSLVLGGRTSQNVYQNVLLVSGSSTGEDAWTTFYNAHGSQTGIIDAINATWAAASAAGASLTGKQTFSDATIAANTDFEVSASIGGTAYTFKSPTDGGSPTDEIEVFFNGMLLSGSNYQGGDTNGADWARGDDSTKPYKIKLAFDVASVDVVNVIFRNPISVA